MLESWNDVWREKTWRFNKPACEIVITNTKLYIYFKKFKKIIEYNKKGKKYKFVIDKAKSI